MPNFSFKGRNRQGQNIAGERVADSKQALALALRREQIFLLDAQEKKAGGGLASSSLAETRRQKTSRFSRASFRS